MLNDVYLCWVILYLKGFEFWRQLSWHVVTYVAGMTTTRVVWENTWLVTCLDFLVEFFTGRMRTTHTPVFKLFRGDFEVVFRPAKATSRTDRVKFGMAWRSGIGGHLARSAAIGCRYLYALYFSFYSVLWIGPALIDGPILTVNIHTPCFRTRMCSPLTGSKPPTTPILGGG